MSVNTDIQKLEPGQLVELYETDMSVLGGETLRFHKHLSIGSIWWQGVEYKPWPVEVEGFTRTSERPATPKLTVANLSGAITALCLAYDDMLGARVTRHRTFGRYLDADNYVSDTNLITNGTFATDLDDWVINDPAKVTWTPGAMVVTGDGVVAGTSYQAFTTVIGERYRVRFTVDNTAATINCGTAPVDGSYITSAPYVPGVYEAFFVATTTTTYFRVSKQVAAAASVFSISVQEVVGNPEADPNEEFQPEIWYIERKASENNELVEFELVSALDLNGVRLPRRQIVANYCNWKSVGGYRGPYCGYTGPAVATIDGTPTDDLELDDCGGKLSDCKLRQWTDGVLNYGGMPAASLNRT